MRSILARESGEMVPTAQDVKVTSVQSRMSISRFAVALPLLVLACSSTGTNSSTSSDGGAPPAQDAAAAAPSTKDGGSTSDAAPASSAGVSWTLRVDGAVGPQGQTPATFSTDDTGDLELAKSLKDLRCGRVWIGRASAFEGIEVYFTTCPKGGKPRVDGHFEVPFQEGSFPSGTVKAPIIAVSVGAVENATLTRYGSRKKVTQATMTVSDVDADATAQPYRVKSLAVHVVGTLPTDEDDACTGAACGVGSDAIDLDLSLKISGIETAASY